MQRNKWTREGIVLLLIVLQYHVEVQALATKRKRGTGSRKGASKTPSRFPLSPPLPSSPLLSPLFRPNQSTPDPAAGGYKLQEYLTQNLTGCWLLVSDYRLLVTKHPKQAKSLPRKFGKSKQTSNQARCIVTCLGTYSRYLTLWFSYISYTAYSLQLYTMYIAVCITWQTRID